MRYSEIPGLPGGPPTRLHCALGALCTYAWKPSLEFFSPMDAIGRAYKGAS